jgi:hypothetical protein
MVAPLLAGTTSTTLEHLYREHGSLAPRAYP